MRSTKRSRTIIICLIMAIFTFTLATALTVAQTPPDIPPDPDATPTPAPAPPSYSPQTSYSPPAFEPWTVPVLSPAGLTIGNLTGVDFFTVRFAAAVSDNESGSLASYGELGSKPGVVPVDMSLGTDASLPEGMRDVVVLASARISGDGLAAWPFKAGTMRLTFSVPSARLDGLSGDAHYYLVRCGDDGYQIVSVSFTDAGDARTAEALVTSLAGSFTLVAAMEPKPTTAPSPTPEPTAMPTPVPTPTPTPAPGTVATFIPLIATFVVGLLAGAIALFVTLRLL